MMFANSKNSIITTLDEATSFVVHRGENATEDSASLIDIHEGKHYKADENMLHWMRVYRETFICQFELEFYPFDVNDCDIKVTIY